MSVAPSDDLPSAERVLAVVAHPDDETFGLGGLLGTYAAGGAEVGVLCLTRGEASALGADRGDLAARRSHEFHAAGAALGVARGWLRRHPDGGLADQPLADLVAEVRRVLAEWSPDLLLGFHPGGITGHADHGRATAAAECLGATVGLPVWAWFLPEHVTAPLATELGGGFVGASARAGDRIVAVDRARQEAALAHHDSQQDDLPVVRRMLELLGAVEHLRPLHQPDPALGRDDPRGHARADPRTDLAADRRQERA